MYFIMKQFSFFKLFTLLFIACSSPSSKVTPAQIDAEEATGNFARASHLIDLYAAQNDLTAETIYDLSVRNDIMHRIRLDFAKDRAAVVAYIRQYYPDVSDEMLTKWENEGTLEYKIIDGQKWYYNRAAPNLFRLDKEAIARKAEVDQPTGNEKAVLKAHLPAILDELTNSGKTQASPLKMTIKFEVTLKPDVIPAGETVRCWLPYPREDHRRQTDVQLISVNDDNYVLSPEQYAHRTIYMEKAAVKDEPLSFVVEYSVLHAPEWFDLQGKTIQPYNKQSELYKTYTSERPPHIVFTDSIKAVSKRVVGDEKDPYQKLKKIFEWINTSFPWAGAREYSTLSNIPQYVLENGHGDCGQVTLLFMTLARYNGIPTRWQSGLTMQPGGLNIHDWSEFYLEDIGWIPMDQSYGINTFAENDSIKYFYTNGIDAFRLIVNNDFSQPLFPAKIFLRSDDVDFQRGELEWRGGNIYYNLWNWDFEVRYE